MKIFARTFGTETAVNEADLELRARLVGITDHGAFTLIELGVERARVGVDYPPYLTPMPATVVRRSQPRYRFDSSVTV